VIILFFTDLCLNTDAMIMFPDYWTVCEHYKTCYNAKAWNADHWREGSVAYEAQSCWQSGN